MALEMFRVVEEDPRWTTMAPELAASKFNPDRQVLPSVFNYLSSFPLT